MKYEFIFQPFDTKDLFLSVEQAEGDRCGFRRDENAASMGIAHGGYEVRVTIEVNPEVPDFLVISRLVQRVREVMHVLGVDLPVVQWREVMNEKHE